MPGKGFNLDEYVDVAERIKLFKEKHPTGSLQSEIIDSFMAEGFIAVKAYAYRAPDDVFPGIGHAWEPFPGQTPYTHDSELQNAETSAWGRAIVAALAADTKKIASRQEVRNRQDPWPEAVGAAAPSVAAATVASTPASEGGAESTGNPPGGSAYGEGAPVPSSDDTLDAVVRAYGSTAKAMLAARRLWPNTTSIQQLDAEQRATLIGEAP